MGSSFIDCPNEVLAQICHSLCSLQDVRHLGLACKRLNAVLYSLGYQPLQCLSQRTKSADLISRRLVAADSFRWATPLIVQSTAEVLNCTKKYSHRRGPPKEDHKILAGCQNWSPRSWNQIRHASSSGVDPAVDIVGPISSRHHGGSVVVCPTTHYGNVRILAPTLQSCNLPLSRERVIRKRTKKLHIERRGL